MTNTADGRNPAPGDMENIVLFTWFYTSQVVVWDFFHQQYNFHQLESCQNACLVERGLQGSAETSTTPLSHDKKKRITTSMQLFPGCSIGILIMVQYNTHITG